MSQEQANRTADAFLELNQWRRRDKALHELHTPVVHEEEDGTFTYCDECDVEYPCMTIDMLESDYPAPNVTGL